MAGAVKVVVGAMTAYGASAVVQRYGCFALWKLVVDHPGNQAAAEAAGAVQAVVAALNVHRESEQVQVRMYGRLAQACLVKGHAGTTAAAIDEGPIVIKPHYICIYMENFIILEHEQEMTVENDSIALIQAAQAPGAVSERFE